MKAWRLEIEAKAAPRMKGLKDLLASQEEFGRSVRKLISDFELSDDLADPEEDENSEDETSENEDEQPDQIPDAPQDEQQGQAEVSELSLIHI